MKTTEALRDIEIEVAYNVRHMGGYRTHDGRRTRSELIRAASLAKLTERGLGRLRDEGVRTIVDLRSSQELVEQPTPDVAFAGIRMVHAPVFESDASPVGNAEEFPGYPLIYRKLLETGRPAYRLLFETVAESEDRLLFHCAAGKDRTGVAAALLLSLAGVHADDVVEDYAGSYERLRPVFPVFEQGMRERGRDVSRLPALMASKPEDMHETLGYIESRWGSAEGYLDEIGVSVAVRSAVRARLAE